MLMFGGIPTYFSGERFFDFPVIVSHVSWSVQNTQAQDQDRLLSPIKTPHHLAFTPLKLNL